MNIFDPHITGSLSVSASANIQGDLIVGGTIYGTALSGSFTGSFVGDGSRITNVPASAVQGLSLNRIADGAVTASIGNGKMILNANFEPDLTDTRDLGSPTKQWRDLFLSSGSLYINGQQVLSTTGNELRITTDDGESIKIIETGSDTITLQTENGDITLTSSGNGNIELDAPIQIGAGNKILSSDGNSIVFGNGLIITGSIVLSGTVDGVDVASLKSDVDAILAGSSADKNSFAEIVSLINSVDTTNDQSFASFYTASNNRFTSIESTTSSFDGRIDSLETKTGSLDGQISTINSLNTTQNGRLSSLETKTGSLDSDISGLDRRLDSLETESGSIRSTFNSYTSSNNTTNTTQNSRLSSLETKTGSLDSNISTLDGRLDSIESFTSSINDTYATDEDVTRLRGDFNSHTNSVNNTLNIESLRINGLELFTASIDEDVTTLRGDLNTYTSSNNTTNNTQNNRLGSLETSRTSFNSFTSSIGTTIKDKLNNERVISGSSQVVLNDADKTGFNTTDVPEGTNLYYTDARVKSKLSSEGVISGSLQITTLPSVDTDDLSEGTTNLYFTNNRVDSRINFKNVVSGSEQIDVTRTTNYSVVGNKLSSLETTSGSHNTRLNTLESFKTTIETGIELTGSNVTIKGNLLVKGTETRVNSTTVDVSDNIISLNGTGASNAGIEVRDVTSPGILSGSLIWDGVTNYWKGGTKGNEERILLDNDLRVLDGRLDSLEINSGSNDSRLDSLESMTGSYTTTDYYVTGATFNTTDGVVTLTRNDGNSVTVDIDGRYLTAVSGLASGNLNMNNFNIINVNSVSIGDPGPSEGIEWNGGNGFKIFESPNDLVTNTAGNLQFVVNGARSFTLNSDRSAEFTGQLTVGSIKKSGGLSTQFLKADGSVDGNVYLTSHPSVSAATSSNNSGRTYIQDILLDGNGHVTGLTTATETVVNTDTNYYVTGATFSNSTADLVLTRNDGNTVTVRLLDTLSDVTVTGGTYNSGTQTLRLTKSDGSTVDVSGFAIDTDVNWYTTGATFNESNGVITGTRNDGGTWTVDIDGRYLTSYTETDTLNSVVARGNTTSYTMTIGPTLTVQADNSANHTASRIWLKSHNDYRGAGTFMSSTDTTWYAGTPYTGFKSEYIISRVANPDDESTANPSNSLFRLNSSGNLTITGTFSASGYNKTNWDTAYGWGDHSTRGYLTSHPTIQGVSSNNSGRTYIQDILTDANGHITGITTATETVVNTDTNYYTTGATFNTSNGIITGTRNNGGTWTVDLDGRYLQNESDTLASVIGRGASATHAVFTSDDSSRVLYLRGSGNIIQFEDESAVKKWEIVGRDGSFYIYKNDGVGSGMKYQIGTTGNHTITGDLDVTGTLTASSGNSAQWTSAYGWGNHANAGYTTTDYYTTGATFNSGTGIVTFTRNNGATYTLNIAATLTDVTVTGGTYNSGTQTLRLTKSNGTTVDVSGFAVDTDVNWYTTSASFNTGNGIITGTRNDGGTWTVDIDGRFVPYSGGNMTGDLNWGTTGTGLTWTMNTDGAYIKFYNTGDGDTDSRLEYGTSDNGNEYHRWMISTIEEMTLKSDGLRVTNDIYMAGNIVATQAWVGARGYLTTHPTITGVSSNNSGRTYIQDVLTDTNGHVTGLTTATETVVNTDTNYYVNSASFSSGILTLTRIGLGSLTVNLDGRYLERESDTLETVTSRGATTNSAITIGGTLTINKSGTDSYIVFPAQTNDAGYIRHYESNNTSRMLFSVSDDSGTTDYFGFGYNTDDTRFVIYSNGNIYGKGTAEFDGTIYADSGLRVRGDWVRVSGSNGLYFEDYGGGWRMTGTSYVEMYGSKSLHMQNGSIDYVTQLHFNDNVRFYDEGNNQYLNYKWGNSGAGGIKFVDGDNTLQGYVYGSGTGSFGLLDSNGDWRVRVNTTEVEHYSNTYVTTLYANLIYDRNNTAYFLNPAGESNLNTLTLNSTASGTTVFNIQGTQGQLFSITDDLTGDLFSVSDASGVPIFNVNANGTVSIDSLGSLVIGGNPVLTAHPSVSAATSSNNSGRTYIQDILLDSFGHITGITTATETVVNTDTNTVTSVGISGDLSTGNITLVGAGSTTVTKSGGTITITSTDTNTDTNYYTTGATFGTSTGIITFTRNDGGTYTIDIDGKYAESSHTHTPTQVGLGNVSNTAQVTVTNNSSLNGDTRNTRGVTRLYRRDDNSDYSVQTYWTGSYWFLKGYNGDTFHADVQVAYADNAGYATSAGSAASATTADQIDGVGFRNTGSNSGIDADTLNSNGITYYTRGVTNFSGNASDGALYSQAYSSIWQHQIAGDYRSGQIAVRGKNNNTWQAWKKVALVNSTTFTNVTEVTFEHGLGTDNVIVQVYDGGGSLFFPSELRSAGGVVTALFVSARSGRIVVTG